MRHNLSTPIDNVVSFRSSRAWLLAQTILISIICLAPGAFAPAVGEFRFTPPPPPPGALPDLPDFDASLGVRMLAPLYAQIPVIHNGKKNVTVSMTIWLKRVGMTRGPYDMPHQSREAIRLLIWVDNPAELHFRVYGHLRLPTNHSIWRPSLQLETAEPGPILTPIVETGPRVLERVTESYLRPYSMRVELPAGTGDCFKVVELSYPKHKAPICIPPVTQDKVCDKLANPANFSAARPALYITIGPIRHTASTRDWAGHHAQIVARLLNYVPYHVSMGVTGLLLYTDAITRHYLLKDPYMRELMHRGHLRLIQWDMPERAHNNDDGLGRPLGYNYDQALFASHAMLGLSACGTNLYLAVSDIDEYLYFPRPGRRWPQNLNTCMGTKLRSGEIITIQQLQRFEVLSTRIPPEQESNLWLLPSTLGRNGTLLNSVKHAVAGVSGNSSASDKLGGWGGPLVHPLQLYDLAFRQPLSKIHGKPIVIPAADIVAFFVHEGMPVYGRTQLVHSACMVLLHVPNFFRSRRATSQHQQKVDTLRRFQHWVFHQ